jgi:GntR family transcriptional repressor for pyruvate dehydrogenase complex
MGDTKRTPARAPTARGAERHPAELAAPGTRSRFGRGRQVLRGKSLADQVAEQLRREILSGVYAPGDKLHPELVLASELRVNRFTVREAMNKLSQLHLIERRPGAGTVVLDYSRHASVEVLEDLVMSPEGVVNPFVMSNLLETARILSAEVAALAAARRGEADLRELERIAASLAREERLAKLLWLDFDFNWALAGAASNIVPRLVLNSVRGLLRKYAHLLETLFVAPGSITEGYQHVVGAIADRDAERARSLMLWIWTWRHYRFIELVAQRPPNQPHAAT